MRWPESFDVGVGFSGDQCINVIPDFSECEIMLLKGLPVKVADFIGIFNFEWHGQNEVGNIAILVLWRDREKLS